MMTLAQVKIDENRPLELFGTKLIGFTPDNARKLLVTLVFIICVLLLHLGFRTIAKLFLRGHRNEKVVFWIRQGVSVLLAIVTLVGILSVWFDNPTRLATFMGLVTAGVAFALQKPISAIAGYLVILRGKTFGIGDRITMGGVRGDVVALRFTQTTIMEMGQPPDVQDADPAMWVHARQYTGRIVTVSNSQVFDEPIYNYTREFPYLWEEMNIPVSYKDDRRRAEQILLEVADRHTVKLRELSAEALRDLMNQYFMASPGLAPKVYWRLTDNWVELSIRFVAPTHGVRELKDKMSREIIDAFDQAKIGIASGTYEIVGVPPLKILSEQPVPAPPH
ncbi:MAG TPA: mechanosensitive ion channel family protein [Tepidisphaeraceae bacterium]|jgi:small-conductance mechanosensitive channel|nr:mechanosensitive ion channel family protein [Tepidisphaeraceae bacterium]